MLTKGVLYMLIYLVFGCSSICIWNKVFENNLFEVMYPILPYKEICIVFTSKHNFFELVIQYTKVLEGRCSTLKNITKKRPSITKKEVLQTLFRVLNVVELSSLPWCRIHKWSFQTNFSVTACVEQPGAVSLLRRYLFYFYLVFLLIFYLIMFII